MFKWERRDIKRYKSKAHRVHGRFDAQYNAMEKRERERKERLEWRAARMEKEVA